MSQIPNTAIAVIGIDIGKNSFHAVGHDARGAIVLRQKWSRGQVEARLANIPPCRIGIADRSAKAETVTVRDWKQVQFTDSLTGEKTVEYAGTAQTLDGPNGLTAVLWIRCRHRSQDVRIDVARRTINSRPVELCANRRAT